MARREITGAGSSSRTRYKQRRDEHLRGLASAGCAELAGPLLRSHALVNRQMGSGQRYAELLV